MVMLLDHQQQFQPVAGIIEPLQPPDEAGGNLGLAIKGDEDGDPWQQVGSGGQGGRGGARKSWKS